MRCGAVQKMANPTVRFCSVLKIRKSYGAVRCGFENSKILQCGSVRFQKMANLTVRFCSVLKIRKSYEAVRCVFENSKILRGGSVRF